MKIRTLLLALIVLFPCAAFAADKTVRDGSGNLLETWTKKGNRIEVRD